MAQAQKKPVKKQDTTDPIYVVNNLGWATTLRAKQSTKDFARHVLSAWRVLALVSREEPPTDKDDRKIYDTAITVLGEVPRGEEIAEEHRQKAITVLDNAIMRSLSSLQSRTKKAEEKEESPQKTFGKPVAKSLETMLVSLESLQNTPGTHWWSYRTRSADIAELLAFVRKGGALAPAKAPRVKTPAPGTTDIGKSGVTYVLQSPVTRLENMHVIGKEGSARLYAIGAEPSPEQIASFGGREAATNFIYAISTATAARANEEPQGVGAGVLYEAMTGENAANLSDQITGNPHFQRAVELLNPDRRGGPRRDEALAELEQIGPLYNTLYELASIYSIAQVDQRMVKIFNVNLTFEFDILGKGSDFRTRGKEWLQGFVTASIDILRGSGFIQEPGGRGRKVEATGRAIAVEPGLSLATSVSGKPIKFLVSGEIVVDRRVKLEEPVTVRNTETGAIDQQEVRLINRPFLNVLRFEVQLPVKEGTRPVRISGFGAGLAGGPITKKVYGHPYGWMTISIPHTGMHGKGRIVETHITPMYHSILSRISEVYQPVPGVRFDPLTFTQQIGQALWQFGPYGRLEVNTATRLYTAEAGGKVSWSPTPQWEFGVEGGLLWEKPAKVLGEPRRDQMLPGIEGMGGLYPKGMLYARWAPWNEPKRARGGAGIPPGTTPTRMQRDTPAQLKVREAKDFVDTQSPMVVDGAQGRQRAKALAAYLERTINPLTKDKTLLKVATNKNYQKAMEYLKKGHIIEGLRELSQVPYFKPVFTK